jgi:glutamyl-Q tRNA(Asp) synthetase
MTDSPSATYTGRFAPSPTGPMHLGTLTAAMASYLEARHHHGQWLLRIEDLDPPREVPGSAKNIINKLESLGFEWDAPILYQSTRNDAYLEAVEKLFSRHQAYACDCSRKSIADAQQNKTGESIYPGFCRHRNLPRTGQVAIRVITANEQIIFNDRILDQISYNLQQLSGDFVIQRKDKLIAYQLAVVIDDAYQGVTDVVRGADLLDSTPRQIHLQKLLETGTPTYAHIPLVLDQNGEKFSKSSFNGKTLENNLNSLVKSWHHLRQTPVVAGDFENINDFWQWAIANWDITRIAKNE